MFVSLLRDHADQTPIIVVDFLSLTQWVAKKKMDIICGGRPKLQMEDWRKKLDLLKSTGCSLVFFTDLKIEDARIDELLRRNTQNFQIHTDLYDRIDACQTLEEIVNTKSDFKELTAVYSGLRKIASAYGDFYNSVEHECDLEIAAYAKEHNAMAIISEDTDFLIFNGSWKLWSPHDIKINQSGQIRITEYKQNAVSKMCRLSQNQLPLFATLLTNDYTHGYFDSLTRFYGVFKYRVQNVANYVRRIDCSSILDFDIRHITRDVLGKVDADFQRLVKQSLESYNIDAPATKNPNDDPIAKMLLNTDMYRTYMETIRTVQKMHLNYYDMRDFDSGATLLSLKLDWKKRQIGILRQSNKDDVDSTFIVIMKKNINEDHKAYTESPIYPDCKQA